MMVGEDGEGVGADFVGRVAVCGNPVGADDDGGDVLGAAFELEESSGHGVSYQGCGDAVVQKLVACQTRALVVGSGFGVVDVSESVAGVQGADDAEGGAVTGGR